MRNYKMDNIRFLLIFLVVFGHVMIKGLNYFTFGLYNIIYSFHMPAFIFITGYFASFKIKKILLSLVWPYLLMQITVFLFRIFILGDINASFSLVKPDYTLWYLLISALYYLLVPLIKTESAKKKLVVLTISFLLSLMAGYITQIGYVLTLSRFFCFMPFFVCGYYMRNTKFSERFTLKIRKIHNIIFAFAVLFAVIAEIVIIKKPYLNDKTLHGAFSYEYSGIEWYHRLFLILTAFAFVVILLTVIPNKRIPFISVIGRNTFPIYIVHGMLVLLLRRYGVLRLPFVLHILCVLAVTVAVLLLFGNDRTAKIFNTALTGNWILKLKTERKVL